MAYYGKRTITLNSNSVITATVADYPSYVKLTTTNCPSIFYAGVDATKVKFTSDAAGTTQLDHELVREAAAIIEYFVKTSAWTIYLWLGDDDESDTSNPTGVWGTAKYIGHFVNDANDSSGNANHGTVTGATLTADENYIGGACYAFAETNDAITVPDIDLTEGTIIIKSFYDTSGTKNFPYLISKSNAGDVDRNYGVYYGKATSTPTINTKLSNGTAISIGKANTENPFFAAFTLKENDKLQCFVDGQTKLTVATASTYKTNDELVYIGGSILGSSYYYKGKIGFVWIFSDVKSDDWISAVYNNMEDYDNFVTIGSEGAITGVPFSFGTDQPIIRILDASGNVMDNSLESGTYITFGTLPRGYATWVDIYIGEYLGFPLYNAALTGVESDNQLGEASETYESLSAQIADDIGTDNWTDLPLTLGTIAKGQYYHVRLRYTAGDDMALGIKVFAIKVTGDWSG